MTATAVELDEAAVVGRLTSVPEANRLTSVPEINIVEIGTAFQMLKSLSLSDIGQRLVQASEPGRQHAIIVSLRDTTERLASWASADDGFLNYRLPGSSSPRAAMRKLSVMGQPAVPGGYTRSSEVVATMAVRPLRTGHGLALPWMPFSAFPAGVVLLTCLVLPALVIILISFVTSSFDGIHWEVTFDNYRRLVTGGTAGALLWKSIRIGIVVTAIMLLLAYPMAYWIATRRSKLRHFLLLLIFVPYWISYVIRTYAWYPLLGTTGVLNIVLVELGILSRPSEQLLFSEFSVHLGLVYVYFPFAAIPIYLALDRIDRSLLEASTDLGANRFQTFWRVVFPLSIAGTVGGGMLVFILAAGSYVTPKLLGGPSGMMFGEMIADQFGANFNWSYGASLAVAFVALVAVIILVVGWRIGLKQVFFAREA